ncbi:MAG: hypothetical protein RL238_1868 [Actinomycetota bacterium]|jgi:hypothetical protein
MNDDELIARMRAALDEAATTEVEAGDATVVAPPASSSRGRWLAVAAAVVLVAGGVAALSWNRGDGPSTVPATSGEPLPGPGVELFGTAVIIDDGSGPKLAVEVLASLPPQGGVIPLAGFDWSMVEGEESFGGTTWTDFLTLNGTWDGEVFTLTRPPVEPPIIDRAAPEPTPGCAEATADAAADAVATLDWQALRISGWTTDTVDGNCGTTVTAWFDSAELRTAIEGIRGQGHEVTVSLTFRPVQGQPVSTTTTAPDIEPASWYELDLPGFTAEAATYTPCCPPTPAPGPATVMAWRSLDAPYGGILTLTATPQIDGSEPVLTYAWTDMSDERAAELQAKVVPGSGLPYVLDDPSMELVGNGFAVFGELTSQRYTSEAGTVELRVGDYAGQLERLTHNEHASATVAGSPADVVDTPAGPVVVWRLTNGDWAELIISDGLRDRVEEILAALRSAHRPSEFTPTTVTLAVPTTVLPSTTYRANVGGIIDNGDGRGPMLTFFWEESLPPQGGSLPLAGFDWDMVEGEQTVNGVTWLEQSVGVTGTFDGTTFTLTEPIATPFTFTDDVLTYGTLTEGCAEADIAPALAALNALDHQALGLIESSDYVWDGHCGVQVHAMFDTPELRDAIATLGDDVMVRIAFQPVG